VASFCELLDQLRVERAKIVGPAALETQVEVRAGPVQRLLGLGQLHLLDLSVARNATRFPCSSSGMSDPRFAACLTAAMRLGGFEPPTRGLEGRRSVH
jgi:hypothetical protein